MKAKDISAQILAAQDKMQAVTDILTKMLGDASTTAKAMSKTSSQIAVFRQGYQTWKAACAALYAADKETYSEAYADLYPSLLCDISPMLFQACLKHHAFLGFKVSPEQELQMLAAVTKHNAQVERENALRTEQYLNQRFGANRRRLSC